MTTARLPAYLSLGWISMLTIACLLMLFVLQPGLPIAGDSLARMRYISEHNLAWQLGWFSWMLSALGLLMFAVFLRPYARPGLFANVGVALIAFGVIPDLTAETIFKDVLGDIAMSGTAASPGQFEYFESIAMQLTGTIANGAYNIGGLCLNIALLANPRLPRWLSLCGLPAWLLGLGLSLATAKLWLQAAYWFTASAMSLSILWCAAVIAIVMLQPQRFRYHASSGV